MQMSCLLYSQFSNQLFSKPLSLCGNESMELPQHNGPLGPQQFWMLMVQSVRSRLQLYCLHRLDALSYHEFRNNARRSFFLSFWAKLRSRVDDCVDGSWTHFH